MVHQSDHLCQNVLLETPSDCRESSPSRPIERALKGSSNESRFLSEDSANRTRAFVHLRADNGASASQRMDCNEDNEEVEEFEEEDLFVLSVPGRPFSAHTILEPGSEPRRLVRTVPCVTSSASSSSHYNSCAGALAPSAIPSSSSWALFRPIKESEECGETAEHDRMSAPSPPCVQRIRLQPRFSSNIMRHCPFFLSDRAL